MMDLNQARVCVNCEWIFEGGNRCPRCASKVFIYLLRALGTIKEGKRA